MLSYLRFLFQSSNQHGVHSPFVFNFLTKGLYSQKNKFKKNYSLSERIVLSTIAYFNCKNIYIVDKVLLQKMEQNFPEITLNNQVAPYDLIIINLPSDFTDLQHQLHSQSLIIFQKPSKAIRSELLQNKNFRLILDFYHTIIISNRVEQQPQIFKLRY